MTVADAAGAPAGAPAGARGAACDVWMPLLARHLPERLVDPVALARLASFSARVPASVMGAIEIRLAPGPGRVDLGVRILSADEARWFASWVEPLHARYLQRWAEQPDPDPRIPFLWIEFDLHPDAGVPAQPLVIPRLRARPDPDWLVGELLPDLCGRPPSRRQAELVRQCVAALPPPARVGYVFDLRARGTTAVRLSFPGLPPAAMTGFLERLGRDDLARAVSEPTAMVADCERFELTCDLADDILPRVGVEATYEGWTGNDARWGQLFGRLADAGLAAPEKGAAALAWSGWDSPRRAPESWPAAVGEGYLIRWISHVKLVCVPGRPAEAKVYLMFGSYRRGPDGGLRRGFAGE